MNNIVVIVVLTLACSTKTIINGAVNYVSAPYVYGKAAPMQQSYLRSPIQFGAQRQSPNSVPVRRGYYPASQPTTYTRAYAPVHPRAYAPVHPRAYAPVHPRAYAPVHPRVYAPVQPRAYAPVPQRAYAPVPQRAYAPVHPKVYAAVPKTAYVPVPKTAYAPAQLRAYAPVSPRTYAPAQLKAYAQAPAANNAKPRVAYYAPARQPIGNAAVRQPISNAFLRQPIRNVPVQRPVSRTITPRVQWYRNAPMSVPYPHGYAAAQRSGVPVRLVAYGRNHIPRTRSRNTKAPTKARNQQKIAPISKNTHINRNNIALNKIFNAGLPQKTQVARNHINGIVYPSKTVAEAHAVIQPTKPRSEAKHPTGQKLSSFLRHVKNFQDTLKGDTMKQGLIYYNDDVSNKTRHRPTNFAPPTRELGSQGAPGGSRVSLSNEADGQQPETASKAASQRGSERDTIKETGENTPGENIPRENTPGENIPRENIPRENTPRENTPGGNAPVEDTPRENTLRENIPRENTPGENIPRENTPGENTPRENTPRENIPRENISRENTPRENTPRERIPGENTTGENTPEEKNLRERIAGENTTRENTPEGKNLREHIPGENTTGENTTGENTPGKTIPGEKAPGDSSQTGEKVESLGTNDESKTASHFDNPKVDLGLLKEKVLHSNNSQFLKRVLQVLKKYTKLMKSSMAEKNRTSLRPGASIKNNGSNISIAETRNSSVYKASNPEKVDKKAQSAQAKNPYTLLNENLTATSENKNDSQLEDLASIANGFNSTSTAIKIFDLLNKASKLNAKKLSEKEDSHINTAKGENESEKLDSDVKDENASKKGEIETKHNLGKAVFNLMKLQYGLERGNTIN